MIWTPTRIWDGEAAYLVGGGASLTKFDFRRLRDKKTIGCNDAFRLGRSIIDYVCFGDATWFHRQKWELERWGGPVVCAAPAISHLNLPWLHPMNRQRDGLATGNALAWNYSTGAMAINLAISFGANPIYLLGYDLQPIQGQTHWHKLRTTVTASFQRFQKGFLSLATAVKKQRPDVQIVNVTDGSSALNVFERKTFAEVFPLATGGVAETKVYLVGETA